MNHPSYMERTFRKYENVLEMYGKHILKPLGKAADVWAYETKEHLRKPPEKDRMQPITPDTKWGGEYGNLWLSAAVTVPAEAEGHMICALVDAEAYEILCFKNGKPAGIINSKYQTFGGQHPFMFVAKDAKVGETIEIAFECYAHHEVLGTSPLNNYGLEHTSEDFIRTYRGITLCMMDTDMRDFCFDLSAVLQMARLPEENFASIKAYDCLKDAFPYLIQDVAYATDEELRECAKKLRPILAPALEKAFGNDGSRGKVGVVGHSHMDTAWLWPVEETIRKCARTYSEVLTLMDIYPEYTFIQSSALHLDWMREYYPDIFEGIKQRVAEGRYEPNGGVWVECDCNVTGGEAMVRQFLYGQRFTEEHFGYRSDAFWLPDTFGYNGAIPQIMLGTGVKYFFTTKLAWADLNQFPTDTFIWRGIDGSEVLTHLNRIHMEPNVNAMQAVVNEIRDKHSNSHRLLAYGYGDGGGGPTYGMLEDLKRVTDLPGMPKVEQTTISKFMKEQEKRKDRLPLYDGELYLEFHRGTLTQMHDIKKNNRLAEIALRDMELMGVLTEKEDQEKRDRLYKVMLKNQFHDILPGTSIRRVYEIAIPEMEGMIAEANAVTAEGMSVLSDEKEGTLTIYNPLSFDRQAVTVLDGAVGIEGVSCQSYVDHEGNDKTAVMLTVPAMSAVTVQLTAPKASESAFTVCGNQLITPYYNVTFDENGYMASLVDRRADREVRNEKGAPLGTLWFGECFPTIYDNWEVEDDIFDKLFPVKDLICRDVISDGAVEYRIRSTYRLSKTSTATLDTVFYANDPKIDYELKLDWNEKHALLKAGFDVNVRSAYVKNEIQFGHIDRPTTRNNALEAAKFEVCNHKWSDISESRYGVAVLNDCKYAISAEGSDLRLTLQKGCYRPDPITDNGVKTMTYSLLPHVGAFSAENVVYPAYSLNYKPIVCKGTANIPTLFTVSAPNVICEAVKTAEDVENAYVLRLYECERNTTNCKIAVPNAKRAYLTNMLEEKMEELPIENGEIKLKFHPFEIKTVLLERE